MYSWIIGCKCLASHSVYLSSIIAPTPGNFPYYVLALALNIGSTYGLLGSYVGMAGILYLGVLNQFLSHNISV
ncbi:hypothetical protein B9Z55_009296 [Caenorhabditis nigoni]|uniref:7TM GPCR serpentine receptor class x (Srx) domain-containing protein n=1 Tax=Caenorhabditis nigoni TaxID=1611254 RepID=A0A2G5US93_9PELO|nr:hypothetical protein B9Z55_009296 [Caenorhabditis nigoni]